MPKQVISTKEAPAAIGPYSQAIKLDNMLFLSGQIPIDPKTGEISTGVKEQTEQVLKNIKAILNSSSMDLPNVVKTTVYLKDLADFQAMNEVYSRWFSKDPPARSTVEVSRLPKDVKIEIDAVAAI